MPMTRARKEQEVADLHKRFAESESVIVTHNLGLTVAKISELRAELRKNGALFKVTKNTLARRAVEGTAFEGMAGLFTGPTGVATSQDPVAAAKIVHEFVKQNDKMVIVGGALGGHVMDAAGVEQLAKLPSLDELRGKLIGVIMAPAQKLAGVTAAPAGGLARVIGAYASKGE